MTQTELEQILRKAYQLDGWKNVAKTAMQFMRPPTDHQPSPATQTLVERLEAVKKLMVESDNIDWANGLSNAISIARQHTDDQSRELEEARQRNAELVEACEGVLSQIAGPHGLPVTIYGEGVNRKVIQGWPVLRDHVAKLLAILSQSQPHRPEPAKED